jgi:hypothetical protein
MQKHQNPKSGFPQDVDNYRWGSLNFHESEHELKEGLAQYYTSRVVINLHERIPGIEDAYRKLLEKQPSAYNTHEPWVKNTTPEAVRNTMILLRKYNPINFGEFSEQLYAITNIVLQRSVILSPKKMVAFHYHFNQIHYSLPLFRAALKYCPKSQNSNR